MSIIEVLLLLVIASVCGGIGQSIAGYSFGGCVVSIVVGFIGAMIGQWLMNKFNLPEFFTLSVAGKDFHVVWAIIGATVFSVIIGILTRGRKEH